MSALNNFDNYISLGYVCNVASYIAQENKRFSAYVFDRMGTPMWAVSELVANNFDDFLTKSNISAKVLFDKSDKTYVTDSKYYLRLMLTEQNMETAYDSYVNAVKLYKNRFMTAIMNSKESILFIRSEEPTSYTDLGNRIELPEYAEKYKHNELYYVQQFSDTIKKINPDLNFKILFLNKDGNMIDDDHNIIGVPVPECDYRDPFIAKKMVDSVNQQGEFLAHNLKPVKLNL
jgi:Xaa-Pro aminopeptidase